MKRKIVALGIVTLLAVGVWSLAASQPQESKKGEKGMRLAKPRIAPLTEAEWTEEQRKVLEPFHQEGKTYNVIGTLARHWQATQKFLIWGYHVMGETSTLSPRERELLILRTGWLC